jgi:uncharacterized protein (TIGR00106 family)
MIAGIQYPPRGDGGRTVAIAEINIIPLGTTGPAVGDHVADALSVLKERGVDFEVTAMGTIIEGKLEAVLDLARRMHEAPFSKGVLRVVTTIKIDDRRDRDATMAEKVNAVRQKLRRGIRSDDGAGGGHASEG